MLGFPIRTPSDHSSVDNSPRTIAASHVLHRLLMPRHPPCALTHLTTTRCSHPLCNTQHTTTPHTTHRHHTATTITRSTTRALGQPGREWYTQETPRRCPLRTQQCVKPILNPNGARPDQAATLCSTQPHPHPHQQTSRHICLIRRGISERRPSTPHQHKPATDIRHTINTMAP